jgi:3-hydroxybutyryl-CoA dehydrogenase
MQAELKRFAVIGGGLMGAGIAQVLAAGGRDVTVFEPDESARASVTQRIAGNLRVVGQDESAASRVRVTDDLETAVASAQFVTEAAPEKLELKRSIFADLVRLAPRDAILASNTSVIPITRIAAGLDTAERIVGTHWWNPPYLVPLVEVVQAERTSDEVIAVTMDLLRALGKAPAHVRKDVSGFVANRLQHALWRKPSRWWPRICDARTLDSCVKNSFGLRLPVLGPLENADLVGLDLTLDIHKTIIPELDRSAGPNPYLEAQVAAGRLGFKSGEGFRSWTEQEKAELRTRLAQHLVKAQRERNRQ